MVKRKKNVAVVGAGKAGRGLGAPAGDFEDAAESGGAKGERAAHSNCGSPPGWCYCDLPVRRPWAGGPFRFSFNGLRRDNCALPEHSTCLCSKVVGMDNYRLTWLKHKRGVPARQPPNFGILPREGWGFHSPGGQRLG